MSHTKQDHNQFSPAHAAAYEAAANRPTETAQPVDSVEPSTHTDVSNWSWVPVRSLTPRHRSRIEQHLLGLDQHDRYLRFGYPATNAHIARYVENLDFERDEIFGIFNRKVELIAAAHLAYAPTPLRESVPAMAEFGVSVSLHSRGRGFGARLFDHAILHSRNRGVETLFIHALSENKAMLQIARKAGANVVRDGSESDAWLTLPPETIASRFDEVVGQHAAEIDYQFKWHVNRVHVLWDVLSGGRLAFLDKREAANTNHGRGS